MKPVESLRVKSIQMPHRPRQIPLRGTQTKMIVIPHQTPPKHFDSPAIVDLPNRVKKHLPILFIDKDFVPRASTVHDVIDSSGVLNAKWPSHDTAEYQKGHQLSTKDLTPYVYLLSLSFSSFNSKYRATSLSTVCGNIAH